MGKKVFLSLLKRSFSKALLSGSSLVFRSFWCLVVCCFFLGEFGFFPDLGVEFIQIPLLCCIVVF